MRKNASMALQIVTRKSRKAGEKYLYPAYGGAPAKLQISVKEEGKPRSVALCVRLPKRLDIARLEWAREQALAHIADPSSTAESAESLFDSMSEAFKQEAKDARKR